MGVWSLDCTKSQTFCIDGFNGADFRILLLSRKLNQPGFILIRSLRRKLKIDRISVNQCFGSGTLGGATLTSKCCKNSPPSPLRTSWTSCANCGRGIFSEVCISATQGSKERAPIAWVLITLNLKKLEE